MRKKWLFIDPDEGSNGMLSSDPLLPPNLGGHLVSPIVSFVGSSRYLYVHGSLVFEGAFNYMSKFAGALVLWLSGMSNSNINSKYIGNHMGSGSGSTSNYPSTQVKRISSVRPDFGGFCHKSKSRGKSRNPVVFGKISCFSLKKMIEEAERLRSFPVLSLAAALVSPTTKISSNVLAIPMETGSVEAHGSSHQGPCEIENRRCGPCTDLYFQSLALSKAVEPRTGVEFPTILDESLSGVLVGTGSRTMTIVRIKSLKLYAFGFYVHPFDVCEKLGPKYACVPEQELNKHQEFYRDLLREDINMTVRLVVSCNGIKISTVKDVFEKSLRARLARTNPEADFGCLQTFGSIFSEDIPLHVGTTINFKRTAEGHLITEVGGNQIGAVQSKDLCRAFFDMYIGDIPVCDRTKQEIGKNVASIIRTC